MQNALPNNRYGKYAKVLCINKLYSTNALGNLLITRDKVRQNDKNRMSQSWSLFFRLLRNGEACSGIATVAHIDLCFADLSCLICIDGNRYTAIRFFIAPMQPFNIKGIRLFETKGLFRIVKRFASHVVIVIIIHIDCSYYVIRLKATYLRLRQTRSRRG